MTRNRTRRDSCSNFVEIVHSPTRGISFESRSYRLFEQDDEEKTTEKPSSGIPPVKIDSGAEREDTVFDSFAAPTEGKGEDGVPPVRIRDDARRSTHSTFDSFTAPIENIPTPKLARDHGSILRQFEVPQNTQQTPSQQVGPDEGGEEEPAQEPVDDTREAPPPPEPPPEETRKMTVFRKREEISKIIARLKDRYSSAPTNEGLLAPSGLLQESANPMLLLEGTEQRNGVMVALWPTPSAQRKLAARFYGSIVPEDIHLTLVFFGPAGKLGHANIATVSSIIDRLATRSPAISGVVSGIGRFNSTSNTGKDVIYVSFTSPTLDTVRESLIRSLNRSGIPYSTKYGFTPHMTIAYVDQYTLSPIDRLKPFRIRFSRIGLSVGEWRHDYMLGG